MSFTNQQVVRIRICTSCIGRKSSFSRASQISFNFSGYKHIGFIINLFIYFFLTDIEIWIHRPVSIDKTWYFIQVDVTMITTKM